LQKNRFAIKSGVKKLLTLILIIVISIAISGCNRSNFKVSITDAQTGFPIEGKIELNGKISQINNGLIGLDEGNYTIKKDGYGDINIALSGSSSSTVNTTMEPISYLSINTENQNLTIFIDGNEVKGKFQENKIIISPVSEGQHSLTIEAPFYQTDKISKEFYRGENIVNLKLTLDNERVQELFKNLEFPEDNQNFNFSITVNGSISNNKFSYSLKGSVNNGSVNNINDSNISYTFKNGQPYVGDQAVTDPEQITVLEFARDTVQEFLQFKDKINDLQIKDISSDNIIFTGEREFETRKFSETITINISNNKISSLLLNIYSQDLQIDLNASILID
jgi:hypothetical protein